MDPDFLNKKKQKCSYVHMTKKKIFFFSVNIYWRAKENLCRIQCI